MFPRIGTTKMTSNETFWEIRSRKTDELWAVAAGHLSEDNQCQWSRLYLLNAWRCDVIDRPNAWYAATITSVVFLYYQAAASSIEPMVVGAA